jgi:hypothetical protein
MDISKGKPVQKEPVLQGTCSIGNLFQRGQKNYTSPKPVPKETCFKGNLFHMEPFKNGSKVKNGLNVKNGSTVKNG